MLALAFESFWLWYLAGVVLWSFLGLLVASSQGFPIVVGVLVGAVFWFVGVAVLLIVGLLRTSSRSVLSARTGRAAGNGFGGLTGAQTGFGGSAGFGAAPSGLASSSSFGSGSSDFGSGSSGFASAPSSLGSAPSGFAAPSSYSPPSGFSSAPSFGAAPGSSTDPWGLPTDTPAALPATGGGRVLVDLAALQPKLLAGAAALCGVGMIISVFLPWGSGSVAWSKNEVHVSGGIAPTSVSAIALVIFVSGLVVLGAAALSYYMPRGTWIAAAAIVTTWWFCLIVEWLVVKGGADSVTNTVHSAGGRQVSATFGTAPGVWIMLASCCGVYLWATMSTVVLIRSRSQLSPSFTPRPAALGYDGG